MRLEFEPIVAPQALSHDQSAGDTPLGNSGVEQTLKMAIAAAQNGDRNTARVQLFKVTEADPTNVDAWLWLASVSEYPEELLGFLVKVLEIDPQNDRAKSWERATRSLLAKTFVQRGSQALDNGQPDVAVQCFDEALEYDLSCESAWFQKSDISRTDEEKELCLARVLDINPTNREALQALHEINTNRSAAKLDAARVAGFAGDTNAATETVNSILAADPENVAALKLKSQLVASFAEKLEAYKRVLSLDPNDEFARAGHDFLAGEQTLADAATLEPALAAQPVETPDPEPVPEISTPVEDNSAEILNPFESFAYVEPKEDAIDLLEMNADLARFEAFSEPALAAEEFLVDEPRTVSPAENFESVQFEAPAHFAEEVDRELDRRDEALNVDVEELETPVTFVEHVGVEAAGDRYEATVENVANTTRCDFCGGDNEVQAISCGTCRSVLSMSDIDTLFSNTQADAETVQDAVTRMEAEWNLREFSESELTVLGLGHFNLRNFDQGLSYFQEASSLNPNNVILAGQVNAFAIRLDEMHRQEENREALPKGKTILVVDDSATVRRLISSKLEKCGHNVLTAVDGVEAMEIIEGVVPDLVLLDIAMPRMDGYSVCKLIRSSEAVKDVPVVMISGKDGFFDKVRGRMAGTTGYITKPFGPETLMRALDTYLVADGAADDFELEEVEA